MIDLSRYMILFFVGLSYVLVMISAHKQRIREERITKHEHDLTKAISQFERERRKNL